MCECFVSSSAYQSIHQLFYRRSPNPLLENKWSLSLQFHCKGQKMLFLWCTCRKWRTIRSNLSFLFKWMEQNFHPFIFWHLSYLPGAAAGWAWRLDALLPSSFLQASSSQMTYVVSSVHSGSGSPAVCICKALNEGASTGWVWVEGAAALLWAVWTPQIKPDTWEEITRIHHHILQSPL